MRAARRSSCAAADDGSLVAGACSGDDAEERSAGSSEGVSDEVGSTGLLIAVQMPHEGGRQKTEAGIVDYAGSRF
jgi:hypothetical protein